MEDINFCPDCGKDLLLQAETVTCDCGSSIDSNKLKFSQRGLVVFDDEEYLPADYRGEVEYYLDEGLRLFKLDGLYFRASSAKKDLNEKIEFIQNSMIPSLNEWKELLEFCEAEISEHKSNIALKIFNITNIILKEYYGPYKVNPVIQEFESLRDFSMYNVRLDLGDNDLNFEMQNELALSNVIGNSLTSGVDTFFSSHVFEKENSDSELTENDLKVAGIGAGISILGNLITGVSNIMEQNTDVIEMVREADLNLNKEIEKIKNTTQGLAIHENEILKRKRTLLTEEKILEYCNNFSLKPVFDKCFSEPIYIKYKNGRHDLDVGLLKTKFEENVLLQNVRIPFWKIIFGSKNELFKKAWKKRISKKDHMQDYKRYNQILSLQEPSSYEDVVLFKNKNEQMFKNYEKEFRPVLENLPSFIDAKRKVNTFTLVLTRIKANLQN